MVVVGGKAVSLCDVIYYHHENLRFHWCRDMVMVVVDMQGRH
jgi:hypothetical protein